MDLNDYNHLKVRLVITIVGSVISLAVGARHYFAYRTYADAVKNPPNDLYTFGFVGFILFQSAQRLVFAVWHVAGLNSFPASACMVNAVLSQFLDVAAQVCAFGFFTSILTLRGRWARWCSRSSVTTSGVTVIVSGGLPQQYRRNSDAVLLAQENRGVTVIKRSCVAATGSFWLVCAVILGVVTSVVMCLMVIKDPSGAPLPHSKDPQNFEAGLGWCWIPKGHDLLRALDYYLIFILSGLASVYLFCVFASYEQDGSLRRHAPLYARLVTIFLYVTCVFTVTGVAQYERDETSHELKYVATAMTSLFGAMISVVFLWTENMLSLLWSTSVTDTSVVFGTGFSNCLNHLLMMEVSGVAFPPSMYLESEDRGPDSFLDDDLALAGVEAGHVASGDARLLRTGTGYGAT